MSEVKIKKAKIKDDLFLDVEFTEDLPGHSKKDTKLSCTIPIHDDMKAAFKRLHVHLAIICDQRSAPKKKDFETTEYETFDVRGFTISGNDENEGVTISGQFDGKYGVVNLNTPFTKWEDSDYPFASELSADVERALYEVNEYLFNGKRAPERQLEMDFSSEGGEDLDSKTEA